SSRSDRTSQGAPGSRLEALDRYAYSVVLAITEAERAVVGDIFHRPSVAAASMTLGLHGLTQVRVRRELLSFDHATEPVTHDEPTWLIHRLQCVRSSSSLAHGRSMPQPHASSANSRQRYWISAPRHGSAAGSATSDHSPVVSGSSPVARYV